MEGAAAPPRRTSVRDRAPSAAAVKLKEGMEAESKGWRRRATPHGEAAVAKSGGKSQRRRRARAASELPGSNRHGDAASAVAASAAEASKRRAVTPPPPGILPVTFAVGVGLAHGGSGDLPTHLREVMLPKGFAWQEGNPLRQPRGCFVRCTSPTLVLAELDRVRAQRDRLEEELGELPDNTSAAGMLSFFEQLSMLKKLGGVDGSFAPFAQDAGMSDAFAGGGAHAARVGCTPPRAGRRRRRSCTGSGRDNWFILYKRTTLRPFISLSSPPTVPAAAAPAAPAASAAATAPPAAGPPTARTGRASSPAVPAADTSFARAAMQCLFVFWRTARCRSVRHRCWQILHTKVWSIFAAVAACSAATARLFSSRAAFFATSLARALCFSSYISSRFVARMTSSR